MSYKQSSSKAMNVLIAVVVVLLVLGICSAVFLLFRDNGKTEQFTAKADEYLNVQKFAYWANEDGKKVSEENPYTYEARTEQNLKAVYEDFVDYDIHSGNPSTEGYLNTVFDAETGALKDCFWFNTCVLTTPLQYGMTIEFSVSESVGQLLYGLSEKSVVSNISAHAWNPNFPDLFVPTYNFYSGMEITTREALGYLVPNASGAVGDKEYFTNVSPEMPYVADSAERVSVRLVLDDTVLLYFNDVLVTADDFPAYTIEQDKEYYFSFAATGTDMYLSDFGYDDFLSVRGNLDDGDLVSSPVSADSFAGKTISILGDSITAGVGVSNTNDRYSSVLASSLNMSEKNFGISGTVYCTGHSSRASRIGDVKEIPLESDYVLVLLGVNDFDNAIKGQFAELGQFGDTDTTTIYGAANAMYRSLVDRFRCTDAKIYICTPVITSWNNSVSGVRDWSQNKENACGYTLPDLCAALKEVAQYYGFPCCDLNTVSGLSESDFADGIHPNESGAEKMAMSLQKFLLENYSYEF